MRNDQYRLYQQELARKQRRCHLRGRFRIKAALFKERIVAMAETLLEREKTCDNACAMLIPLMYALSARINEVDPTNTKRVDIHANSITRDFRIDGYKVLARFGSKNGGETRKARMKLLMLEPELVHRMINYVHTAEWPVAKSFTVTKHMTAPPLQSGPERKGIGYQCGWAHCGNACDGSSRFKHLMVEFGLDTACECIEERDFHMNMLRAISLTLLPYEYDVSECAASRTKAVEFATAMQAGHAPQSEQCQHYIANKVVDEGERPTKRARIVYDRHGDELGLETF